MKRTILLILLTLSITSTFSKPVAIDNLENKIDSLDKRITSINLLVNKLSKVNDSLISIHKSDYDEKLLEKYDTLNGNIFDLLGVVLAIFGLLIPVIGYFVIYLPAKENLKETKKLLDDVENRMDSLFKSYIVKERNIEIDRALSNLEDNLKDLDFNIEILNKNKFSGFNNEQVLRIVKILEGHQNSQILEPLLSIENSFVAKQIGSLLNSGTDFEFCQKIGSYWAKYKMYQYATVIAKYIIRCQNFEQATNSMRFNNFHIEIFNNDELANKMTSDLELRNQYDVFLKNNLYLKADLENTKANKTYESLKLEEA